MANTNNRELLANYLTGTQDPAKRNYVRNPSAHKNVANITVSGATVTRNTSSPLTSISDIQIGFTAAAQTADVSAGVLDRALSNSNCELRFNYKLTLGSGATVQVSVRDGSNTTISQALPAEATNRPVSINFPCGSSGNSFSVRFEQTVGAVTSTLNVANLYLGQATNVGSVAQASFIGSGYIAGTSGCSWSRANTTIGPFSTNSSCPGVTIESNPGYAGGGILQTTDTDLPRFTFNNLPPGIYEAKVTGSVYSSSVGVKAGIAISDGVTTGTVNSAAEVNSDASTVFMTFTYNEPGNRTFEIYGSAQTSGTVNLENGVGQNVRFSLIRYPLSSEIAVRPENGAQTYGIRWAETSSCSWNGTSATYASFAADADCPTPTTYGNVTVPGTKLFNGTFNNVVPGEYEVVFNGVALTDASTNCSYQLWDGTNSIAETNGFNERGVSTLIGRVSYDSLANRTIEVRYKRVSGAGSCRIDAQVNSVQLQMKPIKPSTIAPNLVNSVTSLSTGSLRIESVRITNNGSVCAISNQSSDWISAGTRSGSVCQSVISSGVFASTPMCVCTAEAPPTPSAECSIQDNISATTLWNVSSDSGGTQQNYTRSIICIGPRGNL